MRTITTYLLAGLVAFGMCASATQAWSRGTTYEKRTIIEKRSSSNEPSRATTGTRLSTRQIPEDLRAAGFYSGPIDGRFGPRTSQALKDFQRSKGLRMTGRIDNRTERALMAAG